MLDTAMKHLFRKYSHLSFKKTKLEKALVILLILTGLLWKLTSSVDKTPDALRFFETQVELYGLSDEERNMFQDLLKAFLDANKKINGSYFLYGGTLLGYQRNGDIIPWDDDFDLAMDEKLIVPFQEQFEKSAEFGTHRQTRGILKIFSWVNYKHNRTVWFPMRKNDSDKVSLEKKMLWTWPFIDVFVLTHNDSNETVSQIAEKYAYSFQYSDIYPLKVVKFMNVSVNIPNNSSRVLEAFYGENSIENCQSNIYNHRKLKEIKEVMTVPCHQLQSILKRKS